MTEDTFPRQPGPDYGCFNWESQSGNHRHLWSCHHRHDFVYRTTESLRHQPPCQNCKHTMFWYVEYASTTGFTSLPAIFEREGGSKSPEMTGYALEVVEAVVRSRVALETWKVEVKAWRKVIEDRVRERETLARLAQSA